MQAIAHYQAALEPLPRLLPVQLLINPFPQKYPNQSATGTEHPACSPVT